MRSWNIQRVPTVQPSFTSPSRSVSGTRRSVRNSSQNSFEPLSISILRTSMPGWWIGNMNTVRPRCFGTSQSVRARHRPQSDHHAPSSTPWSRSSPIRRRRESPSCSAPATSDPPLGSERNCAHSASPRKIGGTSRRFCSSLPKSRMTAMHLAQRRRLEPCRVLEAGDLLVQDLLVLGREATASVLLGTQSPARPAS